jgi:hypothetical protein
MPPKFSGGLRYLALCRSTLILDNALTLRQERQHQVVDQRHRNCAPLIFSTLLQLLDAGGDDVGTHGDTLVEDLPELLDRVQVGRVRRPVGDVVDLFFCQPLLCLLALVGGRSILHEDCSGLLQALVDVLVLEDVVDVEVTVEASLEDCLGLRSLRSLVEVLNFLFELAPDERTLVVVSNHGPELSVVDVVLGLDFTRNKVFLAGDPHDTVAVVVGGDVVFIREVNTLDILLHVEVLVLAEGETSSHVLRSKRNFGTNTSSHVHLLEVTLN